MLLPDVVKVAVGTVIKTHGVKGEMAVALDADPALEPGDAVIMEIDGLDVPFFVSSVRGRGADSILLMFDGVESETDALQFVGHTVFVYTDEDSEEDDGDMTAGDLVGYDLWDNDVCVGRIDDIMEVGPGCWYFVVGGQAQERLVPVADDLICGIDAQQRKVVMDLPEGLLDL